MRAVIQRVSAAKVEVENKIVGEIGRGILVLLGVSTNDERRDVEYLVDKILNLRIFEDADGKLNLSLLDVGAALLVVSQFTLYADVRKGRRPSFIEAATPEKAKEFYETFIAEARKSVSQIASGQFQAMMNVTLTNDGPVTILIDSKKET